MHDLIIVGAGPVGSYLAYRVARAGYEVAVLEKQAKLGSKTCCTGIIGKDCHDMLALNHDIAVRQASSAKIFAPSGKFIRISRETTQAYIIDRPGLDVALADKAREQGAQYLLSTSAEGISTGDRSICVMASHDGKQQIIEARAIAITAGFGSRLPQQANIGNLNDVVLGAQAEVISNGIEEVEIFANQELAPGFFAWLVPTSKGKAKVGLLSRNNPGHYLKNFLDLLQTQDKIRLNDSDISYGGIPLKPLPKTYSERLIVIGDAAGQTKPTTGGGIYYGLLCAEIAANILEQALAADDLSAKRLSRYHREWHKKLGTELKVGYWARKFYEKLNNRQIEHIFNIIESNGIHESILASPDVSFDWHGNVILDAMKHKSLQRALKGLKTVVPLIKPATRRQWNGKKSL